MNIPIIEDCLCNNITYKEFFDRCSPLFNMETFNAFILFSNSGLYKMETLNTLILSKDLYSINSPNSFVVQNNCMKKSESKGYILDFQPKKILNKCKDQEQSIFLRPVCFESDKPIFNLDVPISDLDIYLNYNIQRDIILPLEDGNTLKLPLYYFMLDYDDIFNFFISLNNSIAKDLFVIEKQTQTFVSLSDNINIFNLSIFTYKYFDIISLFHDYFELRNKINWGPTTDKNKIKKDKNNILDQLTYKLRKIFLPIEDFIVSVWNLYKFRKFISSMGNIEISLGNADFCKSMDEDKCKAQEKCMWNNEQKNCEYKKYTLMDKFYSSKVSKCEFSCKDEDENNNDIEKENFWETEEYKKFSSKRETFSFDNIISSLAAEIMAAGDVLYNISGKIDIPEYKYIFLIQILSYRLIQKKFIAGGWGFLYKIYMDLIDGYLGKYDVNPLAIDLRSESRIPKIYENAKVIYGGVQMGDCVENTIRQFFKLLLWDPANKNYNLELIPQIARTEYQEPLKIFFQTLNENPESEHDQAYKIKWIDFIYSLEKDTNPPVINFDFIKKGKGKDIEGKSISIDLNANFYNMYNALIKLLEIKIDENKSKIDNLRQIYTGRKLFITKIQLQSSKGLDKLEIETRIKPFNIELYHNKHGSFKESSSSDNMYIIVNNFEDTFLPIQENLYSSNIAYKPMFYKNFTQLVLLKILFSKTEPDTTLLNYYFKVDKNLRGFIYHSIFTDLYIKQLETTSKVIGLRNKEIWKDIIVNLDNIGIFNLKKIAESKGMLTIFTEKGLWKEIFINIKNEFFWKLIVEDKEILEMFTEKGLWKDIIANVKVKGFWDQLIEKYENITTIFTKEDLWNEIFINVQSFHFWNSIFNNEEILRMFTEKGFWKEIIKNVKRGYFLGNIVKNNKEIIKMFTEGLWRDIIVNIEDDFSWGEIALNKEILTMFTEKSLWKDIIANVKSHNFWFNLTMYEDVITIFTEKGLWRDFIKLNSSDPIWNVISQNRKMLMIFAEIGLWRDIIAKLNWDEIAHYKTIVTMFTKEMWRDIIANVKSNKFWVEIGRNKDVLTVFTENNLWEEIIINVKSKIFWGEVRYTRDILTMLTKKGSWRDIIKLNSNRIWSVISDNTYILTIFIEIGLWRDIIAKLDWDEIARNQVILIMFTERGLWRDIIANVKNELFWEEIGRNTDILTMFTKKGLWRDIIANVKVKGFWDYIKKTNMYTY